MAQLTVRYAAGVDPRLTPDEQEWERFKARWGATDTNPGWLPPATVVVHTDTGEPVPMSVSSVWVP